MLYRVASWEDGRIAREGFNLLDGYVTTSVSFNDALYNTPRGRPDAVEGFKTLHPDVN